MSTLICFELPHFTVDRWTTKALAKREMFDDQTSSNILPFGHDVWWCLMVFDDVWSCLNSIKHSIKQHQTFLFFSCSFGDVWFVWPGVSNIFGSRMQDSLSHSLLHRYRVLFIRQFQLIRDLQQRRSMRAPNMFDTAVQMNKSSPIKHENKRNVLSCLIEMFDGLQILSNATKQYQARWPNGKMFGHQTFPAWPGPNGHLYSTIHEVWTKAKRKDELIRCFLQISTPCLFWGFSNADPERN